MQLGFLEMWNQMGTVAKAVSFILIFLSVLSIYFFIERMMTFNRAKNKSKQAAPALADLLKAGKLNEALTLSNKKDYKGSHLARITAAGIHEFLAARESGLSLEEQIESASRGCNRAASLFTQDLKRGFSVLATIATSSPFIGLFGTIFGIITAFRGMQLTGSGGIGAVAGGISEALITTAFGILVAVIALWCYNLLNSKIDVYQAEMENTSSEIVDYFMRKR
ncbi:MAG: MotA/TolQ/ExbB proton channel family protein [Candidatus Aminicenantes bacterium]|nr:MotA/TolQ/ExbB proton channel family protein [Candidatus Aminicenantes bacterium]